MKRIFLFITLLLPSVVLATPMSLAEEHIGSSILEKYYRKPLPEVLKLVEALPANQRKVIGKSVLLNLYGHNFDTTLVHDTREITSFTRVFYDEESAPNFYQQIEKIGKNFFKITKIKTGAKPGTFHDFNFQDQGLFFRFNQNKKIQIITINKKKKAVKT
jgi:hypothetical protein